MLAAARVLLTRCRCMLLPLNLSVSSVACMKWQTYNSCRCCCLMMASCARLSTGDKSCDGSIEWELKWKVVASLQYGYTGYGWTTYKGEGSLKNLLVLSMSRSNVRMASPSFSDFTADLPKSRSFAELYWNIMNRSDDLQGIAVRSSDSVKAKTSEWVWGECWSEMKARREGSNKNSYMNTWSQENTHKFPQTTWSRNSQLLLQSPVWEPLMWNELKTDSWLLPWIDIRHNRTKSTSTGLNHKVQCVWKDNSKPQASKFSVTRPLATRPYLYYLEFNQAWTHSAHFHISSNCTQTDRTLSSLLTLAWTLSNAI